MVEQNWSGCGQHAIFSKDEQPLIENILQVKENLGSTRTAIVQSVKCRRIVLARKTITFGKQTMTKLEAIAEVSHLTRLNHAHIVRIIGTYVKGRELSILLYPVAQYNLETFIEHLQNVDSNVDSGRNTQPAMHLASRSFFSCLSSGTKYIHSRFTKHMDIKPQNILIRNARPKLSRPDWRVWRVYIADFGLSRSFAAQDHSQTDGPTSRTPKYCAPEVYNSEERGRSADIFSLGCVFMEISCVIAGIHPQDFAIVRRGPGIDESFHANIDRIVVWAHDVLYARLSSWLYDSRDDHLYIKALVESLINMVRRDPGERPTATQVYNKLVSFPPHLSPVNSCCSLSPEPFEYYEHHDSFDGKVALSER